jgi:nucleoside-diphosphate-sugar epimerase
MKVFVTGGTGFVGSHSVKAIVDAGHEPRLLVRSRGRLVAALERLGVGGVEHVVGDATDAASVRTAMDGCDAVLHAAAVYSYDVREAGRMRAANAQAAAVVLGAARDAGLDPIVHVSSYVALLPPVGVLDAASPVGRPRGAYASSKAETRTWARRRRSRARCCGACCPRFRPGSWRWSTCATWRLRTLPCCSRGGVHGVS